MKPKNSTVETTSKLTKQVDEHLIAISHCIIMDEKIEDARSNVLALVHITRQKLKLLEQQNAEIDFRVGAIES